MKFLAVVVIAIIAMSSVEAGKWVQMTPSGPYFPGGRYFHAQSSEGEAAYVFGGENGKTFFRDLFVYHTQQNIVEQLDAGTGPTARAGACSIMLGAIVDTFIDTNNVTQTVIVRNDTFVLFGGFDGTNYLNDLWEFNLGTGVWTKMTASGAPGARAFHTCVDIGINGDEELMVFGGTNGNSYYGVPDTKVYSFADNSWATLPDNTPNGIYPAPRAYITGLNNGDNLYFYGGYGASGCLSDTWIWNNNLSAWFAVPTTDNAGPLAAYAGFEDGGEYEIFGGFASCTAASNQMWALSHSRPDWTQTPPSGIVPNARAATVATDHGKDYFLYGGAAGSIVNGTLTVTTVYDDLWMYVKH